MTEKFPQINPDIISHVPTAEELDAANAQTSFDTISGAEHRKILRGMGMDVPEPTEPRPKRVHPQPTPRQEYPVPEPYVPSDIERRISGDELRALREQIAAESRPTTQQ